MPEQQPQQNPQQQQKSAFEGYMAEIVDVVRTVKTGISGEIYSVSCKILEGNDRGRIIRRNVLGPIKIGDVIRLPDTSREAREIKVK
jgi:small subunit ribosomal protein S28e